MKLYDEEQVRKALDFFLSDENKKSKVIQTLTPIKLLSDDEIKKMANEYAASKKQIKNLSNREFDLAKNDFIKASQMILGKIQGGDNEQQ